jgi:hypothetical protein
MLPGIDADMREFWQSGIRKHERELLAANRDEIETPLTTLKLRGDREGRDEGRDARAKGALFRF